MFFDALILRHTPETELRSHNKPEERPEKRPQEGCIDLFYPLTFYVYFATNCTSDQRRTVTPKKAPF